jgi:hypothetical protein
MAMAMALPPTTLLTTATTVAKVEVRVVPGDLLVVVADPVDRHAIAEVLGTASTTRTKLKAPRT